jgi:PAS domain S-box-containing protein
MERAASDMQKENRGYLLTGDPAFIDGYEKAASDFYTFQGYLSVLVANEPDEVKRLNRIGERMEAWITQCAVPSIEAKHNGRGAPDSVRNGRSDSLMKNVRRAMEQFENEQMAIYEVRSSAAIRERILTATGIDLFCAFAAGLMLVSGSYSFVLCRRQLPKLQGADTRIRSVVDNILDGMVTLDENGSIYSMNPAAKQMFGYRANEFFGDDFAQLVPQYFDRTPMLLPSLRLGAPCGMHGWNRSRARSHQGRATFPVEISLSETVVDERNTTSR